MVDTSLISGRFVAHGELDDGVRATKEDIDNFVRGYYGKIRRKVLAKLQECVDDPYGYKWDAAHADCIFCDPDWFFEMLFVNFPLDESWEANYQRLRALVGPKPIDYVEVMIALREWEKRFNRRSLRDTQGGGQIVLSSTPRIRGRQNDQSAVPVIRGVNHDGS